jgi:RNA polymerase sigma-70 factor (ECF subfamily)
MSVQKEVEVKSDMESLQKCLAQLPPLYKQVLELRYLQEFSLDEIAKILKKSNLSVRLLQYRALKKVKIILGGQTNMAPSRAVAFETRDPE